MSRHKRSSGKETRRIEHKSLRQVERQVLHGGHLRPPKGINWNSSVTERDAPLVNDVMPHRSSKKGCKRNKGGPHIPVPRKPPARIWGVVGYRRSGEAIFGWTYPLSFRYGSYYVCEKCNKSLWRYKPKPVEPAHDAEHWTMNNIHRRLAGHPCLCPRCLSSASDSAKL